ncbi:MAG: hypothetical protein NT164_00605 [Verrucomicrobiae bacterium]|nr:hypothetical protein [Verrucomicrobiae bacterium]
MIADYPNPMLLEDPKSDDTVYTASLIAALKEADASIDRGEFVTLEELEKAYYSWCTEKTELDLALPIS